jgi:hypothetical protein
MVMVAACSPTPDASDSTTPSAANADVTVNRERLEDLTGDGRNERLTLVARGPRTDSLDVRLEIRSPEDTLLYASTWNSRFYFQYVERSSMSDAAADSTVRRHLDAVLADTAFRAGAARTPGDTVEAAMMRDAIRYDIATTELRTRHGLAIGVELPTAAHDSVNVLAATVPRSRINALVQELKDRKTFTYFAGGEVTYAIAWSDREQRFVTVFSCC